MRKQEQHPRTVIVNNSQKQASKKVRAKALAWLVQRFPEAFDNSVRIRPLKTGIMNEILTYADEAQVAGISKSKLREAVVLFTRRIDYLTCLKAKDMRIDLEGNPVAVVTDEEAEHATLKIKKRVEKSVKNARKILATKACVTFPSGAASERSKFKSNRVPTIEDQFPIYPSRAISQGSQAPLASQQKAATVLVKNKTSRQFDPNAVARLKEKLGLSRKIMEEAAIAE